MTTLNHITIKVAVDNNAPGILSAQLLALLQELQRMLNDLPRNDLSGDEKCSSIDIHSLPLVPNDISLLKMILGEGEVTASVNAFGSSVITETGISGIWWITHFNEYQELIAEFIEVTDIPDFLKAQPVDIGHAEKQLKSRIDRARMV